MNLEQMSLNQLCELARQLQQALTDSNLALMEQTELAERCRQQAEAMEKAAIPAQAGMPAVTIKQLAAQLGSDEKWTIAEQKAFAPFLAQFPNECSQGIQSLGSAWKHGIAYAQSLAAAPQQHAQASQQEGSRPAAYSEMSLGELLERYWNIAFSEGQDGVSRGSEAQEVLSALMAFGKDAQAALSDSDIRKAVSGVQPEDFNGVAGVDFLSYDVALIRAFLASQQPAAAPSETSTQMALRMLRDDAEFRSAILADVAAAPAIQQEGAALDYKMLKIAVLRDGLLAAKEALLLIHGTDRLPRAANLARAAALEISIVIGRAAALAAPAPVQPAPSFPDGYSINRAEGHGWYIDPPKGGRWVAHDGTPAADLIAALALNKQEPTA